ncbi:hypothetical protein CK203_093077 [Vitis vinifera]|uniref:Uncharacterized protein n=1 Tax=Vitis vinifera TaxID=29760 RepID=A0A438FC43_VITVI|nr:hypothetical protein CK203_093077 [Vitis vinifera]
MEEAKTMKTPMSSSIKLDKDEKGKSIDSTLYRGMIEARALDLGRLLLCPRVTASFNTFLAYLRFQGKCPTKPSQPTQTEARQNVRFDTTLFSIVEDYQRYKQKFAQRKVVPGRSINFSQLQHFEFEGLFIRMGWLPVVTISEPIFPTLVYAFYSRATYELGGPIISTVRGVEIQLDPKSICRILDIALVGLSIPHGLHSDEETDSRGISTDDAHNIMLREHDPLTPYGRFLARVFKDVGVDLSRETDFEAPNIYDTYDEQSLGQMKFEKTLDGS